MSAVLLIGVSLHSLLLMTFVSFPSPSSILTHSIPPCYCELYLSTVMKYPCSASRGGRTRSKCHMTSITLFTCHSAITPGGAWLGTVLVQLVHSIAGVWWEKYGTFDSQEQ